MIITIHQPEHLPWLGYFNKMAKADKYVILDNVPFRKNYVQNRNRILGSNGVQWLGVPVLLEDHLEGTIKTTLIANEKQPKWKEKYLRTIEQSYGKHPFFNEVFPEIVAIFLKDWQYISCLNVEIFKTFAKHLDINPQFVYASDLEVSGNKSDLILSICRAMEADTYIAGPSGRRYLDMNSFSENSINVVFNDFVHPLYKQKKTSEFISHLSAIDLFMNCGYEEAYDIIMKDNTGVSKE